MCPVALWVAVATLRPSVAEDSHGEPVENHE
jgi:hypothetical protein